MKCSKLFFLFIVFATGCAESDFTAKQQSSQMDPSLLTKILVSVGRRVSYTVSSRDYADFVAESHLGPGETSESAYCKLNRTAATRFSNRYTRAVNQAFNSFKVEIPRSCEPYKSFGETVGEMGGGGYETHVDEYENRNKDEYENRNKDEYETQNIDEYKNQNKGEKQSEEPTVGLPGSECKISWEFIPGSVCYDFFPGVLLCCPQ